MKKEHWHATWKTVKKFGESGDGKLKCARGVAINKDGNVAVADYNAKRIHVYGIDDGELELSIDTTMKSLHSNSTQCESYPLDVAVAHGNYIVSDMTQSLTIYDNKGNYVRQIPMTTGATTAGISINSQNHILVGDGHSNHLNVYNYSDGSLISCVNTPINPWYLSASSHDDRIIISSGIDSSALVIDAKGQTIYTLRPPIYVTYGWCPLGVCTIGKGEEEEVFVCNADGKHGVYRFSLSTGRYLGCVTLIIDLFKPHHDDDDNARVSEPRGIVFTNDGKLVVTDKRVNIFMPNTQ